MNEIEEFLEWRKDFRMEDDGIAAFRALKVLESIRFELAVREDGYLERIAQQVEGVVE